MRPVLHSVSYAGLWPGQSFLPLDAFIKRAADLGFEGVEIVAKRPHASVLEMTPEKSAEIAAVLKETGVECTAMAAYTDFTAGLRGSSMIPVNEMQLIYIREVIRLADRWDCKLIRLFTGFEDPAAPYFGQWKTCADNIRECCRMAEPYGITIGIQNHHDIALDAEQLAAFIDDVGCENCAAMFDPWSPAVRGLDCAGQLDQIIDRMKYTTLADYKKIRRFRYEPDAVNYSEELPVMRACAIGDGIVDNKVFLDRLASLGYDGWVAYEMCSELEGGGGLDNLDRCARRFLELMKKYR